MYKIDYYRDKDGHNEFEDYYDSLFAKSKTDKSSRILYNSFSRFLLFLKRYGTQMLPKDYAKHIVDDIWELRPKKHRVLYFYYKNDTYVILHYFIKKTNKTPKTEIEKAIKERNDYVKNYEQSLRR